MTSPEIPIEVKKLKESLRIGLTSDLSRQYWWPIILGTNMTANKIEEDPDIIGSAERLQSMLNEPLLDHLTQVGSSKTNNSIENTLQKINYVLVNQKKVIEADLPYLQHLLRILISQIKRIDVCYWSISEYLSMVSLNPTR